MKVLGHEINDIRGLSEAEAREKLNTDGFNELPSAKKRSIFKIILEIVKEPMLILLVACGSIYLTLGDMNEAVMLLGFVFFIIGITIYQENKTENALKALRDLSSPRALVIRDGIQKRIAGREVVTGDIILINEGDRVPADALLLWGMNLTADESLLTGESIPVRKKPDFGDAIPDTRRPGGDDLPFIYSASLIVQGQGLARIVATGVHTEIGKIGKSLRAIETERTFLQNEILKIVKTVFIVATLLCMVMVLIYGLIRQNWIQGILSGLTLAMAMIPEEFPVVLTVFLAIGAWRISKKQVLTRRMAAVETLGSATVLCVDKTGTLTQNRMSIQKLFARDEFFDIRENPKSPLPETFHELVEYGILASKSDPFDPMEKALRALGTKKLSHTEHLHDGWPLILEYPLSDTLLSLSHVYRSPETGDFIISAKGAPEAITDLCHLGLDERNAIAEKTSLMAAEGMRVLGVARARSSNPELPKNQHDFDFEFLGLVGLADPIRDTVPAAINECYQAGIRVMMITGDYPVTAQNIGRRIGLKHTERILTGNELDRLSDAELASMIRDIAIFARVVPEQKLRIVNALKTNGEIVAMTGDGVNDAPALKSAHIGVAMGERGTDVARESADIVLLKDDFSSIVAAVRLGRRIFDNLKKSMAYIISVHIPIAGISLFPLVFKWPIILFPVHIVFLELIIDPACTMVFEQESEEATIMQRPPRNPLAPLFGKRLILLSLLQGVFSLIVISAVLVLALRLGQSEAEARTFSFFTLIVSNICLLLANRSWSRSIASSLQTPNPAVLWVIPGAALFLGLVIFVPFLKKIFHFASFHPLDILISFGAGILSVMWFEILKWVSIRKHIELLND
ncbi:MAG: cation-translocating P-type ATPase [Candidatus Omnitrophota bacterium]